MWKIDCNHTIFDGKTEYREHINSNLLNRIYESGYDILNTNENGETYSVRNLLKKILKQVHNDTLKVYPQVHTIGYGRAYYPNSISIGQIPYEFRHTILKNDYIDYDLDNAHFNIIYQLALKNGVSEDKIKNIKYYCQNREKCIEDTIYEYFKIDKSHKDYKNKRYSVKQLFIRYALYLGGFKRWKEENELDESYEANTILKLLRSDITYIINEYVKPNNKTIYDDIVKKQKENNEKKNPASTLLSHFISNEERKIIESVLKTLMDRNIIKKNKLSYCYDGFLLPKKDYGDDFLDVLKNITRETTGFHMNWSLKPFTEDIMDRVIEYESKHKNFDMDTFYNIYPTDKDIETIKNTPDDKKEQIRMKLNNDLYERQKEYFEIYHFKINENNTYVRIYDGKATIYKKGAIHNICLPLDLIEFNKDGKISRQKVPKESSFLLRWFQDKDTRYYKKMDFLPPPLYVNSNVYNMFKGFDVEKIITQYDNEDIDIFINHLHYLVGGDTYDKDKKNLNYMIDYLADIIQNPGSLPKVSILIKSNQGIGKNLFFDKFGRNILGKEYYLQTDNIDVILSRFNKNHNKLMVVMDEASGKDTFLKKENIKNVITAEVLNYEKKNIDSMEINNVGRYLFFSNNDVPISISLDDRRFICFEGIMPLPKLDKSERYENYFKPLINAFNDEDMCKSFYMFLKNRKITHNLCNDRPKTHIYKEIQKSSIPIEIQFIEYFCKKHYQENLALLKSGKEIYHDDRNHKDRSEYFYKDFKRWAEKYHNSISTREKTSMKFKAKLRCVFKDTDVFTITSGTSNYTYYSFNYEDVLEWLKNNNLLMDG